MNLGDFRKLTKDLPDDADILFDSANNPFGNCWEAFHIELTERAFFGAVIPAVKLYANPPASYGENPSPLLVHPEYGNWSRTNSTDSPPPSTAPSHQRQDRACW